MRSESPRRVLHPQLIKRPSYVSFAAHEYRALWRLIRRLFASTAACPPCNGWLLSQAMSGPAVPGRFSFRFSRQPAHVTVDYTVQGLAVEGRPQVRTPTFSRAAFTLMLSRGGVPLPVLANVVLNERRSPGAARCGTSGFIYSYDVRAREYRR